MALPRAALALASLSLVSPWHPPAGSPRPAYPRFSTPIVLPVTTLPEPPYSTQLIWTAFSGGNDAPGPFHGRDTGHECEITWHFMRREFAPWPECHALELLPWLRVPDTMTDSALAKRAVIFADSVMPFDFEGDSLGLVHALVVAVVGRDQPPNADPRLLHGQTVLAWRHGRYGAPRRASTRLR